MENQQNQQKQPTCDLQPKTEKKSACFAKRKRAQDEFRRKYFDYYDDVKDRTKGKEDW